MANTANFRALIMQLVTTESGNQPPADHLNSGPP